MEIQENKRSRSSFDEDAQYEFVSPAELEKLLPEAVLAEYLLRGLLLVRFVKLKSGNCSYIVRS